jgi:UDPglucose 6-dehydrogenase
MTIEDESSVSMAESAEELRVCYIGMGYVGLTSGVVSAKHGLPTICTDTIESRIDNLNNGVSPFFEPGLDELVKEVTNKGLLKGSTDNIESIMNSDVTFICVGTPSLLDGSADLTFVKAAAKDIGIAIKDMDRYHVVVTKSTVLPGTTEEVVLPIVEEYSHKKVGVDFGLCMNPEFLRQGSAVHDTLEPDRIIIGQWDTRSGDVLDRVYNKFECPKIRCDIKAAELIKYAANALLATKISFANEFSRICEEFNIDVYEVMEGVGLDFRINPFFLNAGCGFGGSCFPKDVKAIVSLAKKLEVDTPIMDSVLRTNELQPLHFVDIVDEAVGGIGGKTFAFLGLSFKPNTDDTRETRALPIIHEIYKRDGKIKAYDPKAVEKFKPLTDLPVEYVNSVTDALQDTDACIIQSDWDEFRNLTADDFKGSMKNPVVVDGRRTFGDPGELIRAGVKYFSVGWKNRI